MRNDEPDFIGNILDSRWFWLLARVVVAFMFWITAIEWIIGFQAATGAAASVGLWPVGFWTVILIAFYLAGSLAILFDRYLWLGTGAFGVFTLLTIFLSHAFWTMEGEEAHRNWLTVKEHVTVIGGLMCAAIVSHLRKMVGI